MTNLPNEKTKPSANRFAILSWFILGYNVLVVLWGAFVRATGSGAGCGDHWPLCNGVVIPHAPRVDTMIELTHRLSTGLLGILVLWMVIWAFRCYRKDEAQGRAIRRAAGWTLFFILTESAIGAGIVKFEWVADNVSLERVYTIAFHLINTFVLLGANTLVAWFASGGEPFSIRHAVVGPRGSKLLTALGLATIGLLLLGASGAITALGDTLFYTAGITPAESPLVARLVSLRFVHPLIAFGVLALLWWVVQLVLFQDQERSAPTPLTRRFAWAMLGIFFLQLVAGGVNVYLKAPVWMQILHLLLSDFIWILMVLTAASSLAERAASSVESNSDSNSDSNNEEVATQAFGSAV